MRSDYIFYPIIKKLSDEYKIYTFDYPGGLKSKYMEAEFSISVPKGRLSACSTVNLMKPLLAF